MEAVKPKRHRLHPPSCDQEGHCIEWQKTITLSKTCIVNSADLILAQGSVIALPNKLRKKPRELGAGNWDRELRQGTGGSKLETGNLGQGTETGNWGQGTGAGNWRAGNWGTGGRELGQGTGETGKLGTGNWGQGTGGRELGQTGGQGTGGSKLGTGNLGQGSGDRPVTQPFQLIARQRREACQLSGSGGRVNERGHPPCREVTIAPLS